MWKNPVAVLLQTPILCQNIKETAQQKTQKVERKGHWDWEGDASRLQIAMNEGRFNNEGLERWVKYITVDIVFATGQFSFAGEWLQSRQSPKFLSKADQPLRFRHVGLDMSFWQTDPSMVTLKVLVDGLGNHHHNHDMSYDHYDQHLKWVPTVWYRKKLIWSRLAKRVASVLGEDRPKTAWLDLLRTTAANMAGDWPGDCGISNQAGQVTVLCMLAALSYGYWRTDPFKS